MKSPVCSQEWLYLSNVLVVYKFLKGDNVFCSQIVKKKKMTFSNFLDLSLMRLVWTPTYVSRVQVLSAMYRT